MRAIASGRRAGRPAMNRPAVDPGTPELLARRARLAAGGDPSLTESPLGILLARGLIGREQHDSGRHYASLYRQSVGRTGVCWDNAVAESFWSSLKREVVHRYRFATRADARRAIFAWINRYNHRRLHSSLGYLPPVAWEQRYRQSQADLAA